MNYRYKNITFTGSFWGYFFISILLLLATIVSFGILLPYYIYWNVEYFFSNMEIDGNPLRFTGSFWEYFFTSLFFFIVSVITFGLFAPYYAYWSFKYFFERLEVPDVYESHV